VDLRTLAARRVSAQGGTMELLLLRTEKLIYFLFLLNILYDGILTRVAHWTHIPHE
jgi:hypothetical protein